MALHILRFFCDLSVGGRRIKTLALLLLLAANLSFSNTLYVSPHGSHEPPFSSWVTSATNIQSAIDFANAGDSVYVTNGTYFLSDTISVTNDISILSMDGPEQTIVDGQNSVRCFRLAAACSVSGFTITNGFLPDEGGNLGAGLYCSPGVVVSNCWILGNVSLASGGGMFGGHAIDCIIKENRARYYGGGIFQGDATGCRLIENIAESTSAGGMWMGKAVNCLFIGNHAHFTGGGIKRGEAIGCTFVLNSAGIYGGGMYECTATNCIVWGNSAPSDADHGRTELSHSCSSNLVHGDSGNITNLPVFVSFERGNFQLASSSPCIDSGTLGVNVGMYDLDGAERVVGGSVDMGAYEFLPPPDIDGDGLPDGYELQFSGTTTGLVATAHSDDDRMSNWEEYIAGTNPTNSASFLAIRGLTIQGDDCAIGWNGASNRLYRVGWTNDLSKTFQPMSHWISYPQSVFTGTLDRIEDAGYFEVEARLR